MRRVALIVAGIAVSTASASAFAQSAHSPRARSAFDQLDFGAAITEFEAVVRDASATRSELATAWQHLAMLRYGQGDTAGARAAAASAAALDRSITAPSGSPPPVNALFARARSEQRTPLAVRIVDAGPSANVQVDGVSTGLAVSVRVTCESGQRTTLDRTEVASRAGMRIDATGTQPWHCAARLVIASGAVIDEANATLTPVSSATGNGSRRTSPWIVVGGVAGGALVVAAVVIGVVVGTAPPGDLVPLGPVTFSTATSR